MININTLVNHVKARLGTHVRHLEMDDEAIINCLQQETLPTLSIFFPYYCQYLLNLKEAEVQPGMNTYFLPTEIEDFSVMGVEGFLPAYRGLASQPYFFAPMGSDLQSIMGALNSTKLANTLASAIINPSTFTWMPPNMVRLSSNYSMEQVIFCLRTTHKKDFSTFPYGAMETIKKLALYDVAMDIYSIRKHFAQINTIFAQINLDMDFFNSIPDKRDDLVERLRKEQLKYSNAKKIYIY
jgi:hypothetical protein